MGLKLEVVDITVDAIRRQEIIMGSLLRYLAVFQDYDQIGFTDSAQAVGNDKCGPVLHHVYHRLMDHAFGLDIDTGRRVVQDQYRRV